MVKLLQLDMVKSKRNVDVEDLSLVGLIETNQGIEYKIDFFIHKQKGYIFVEQDENYVLTISKLRSLLRLFTPEARQYVKYLNTLEDEYLIESKPIIDIEIIKPLDIKEQIKLLTSVKSVSLFEKIKHKIEILRTLILIMKVTVITFSS